MDEANNKKKKKKKKTPTLANSAGGTLSPLLSQPSCNFLYASLILPCFSDSICLAKQQSQEKQNQNRPTKSLNLQKLSVESRNAISTRVNRIEEKEIEKRERDL